MKLTITNDRKEESEEVLFVPEIIYSAIMSVLQHWRVFPTPSAPNKSLERNTDTNGAGCCQCKELYPRNDESDHCLRCGGLPRS